MTPRDGHGNENVIFKPNDIKRLLTLRFKKIAVTRAEIPTTRDSMLTPTQTCFEQQSSSDLFLSIMTENIKWQIGAGYKMLHRQIVITVKLINPQAILLFV